jgi:RND family efflux transporter MFP subunit
MAMLVACGPAKVETEVKQNVQAVKLALVTNTPDVTERTFPAEVSAVKTIDVSFEVSGRLLEENLLTGTLVKQGDILAKIEPTPFVQRLQEAEARLKQAQRDSARTESTFKKGLASQAELDNAKTALELALIALDKAKQDVSYTTLLAPFDAQISERLVENNSYVRAGDSIARLQDVSRYYFNIHVPERLVSQHKDDASVSAEAHIIWTPEKTYTLEYVEHATQPDPITQTYKVVFAANDNLTDLTPGSRAIVKVKLGYPTFVDGLLVPFSAIQGDQQNGFNVWKFDTATSQVTHTAVDVLHVENEYALVAGALNVNDQVVAAGASKMREGLTVKAYQAER